MTWINPDATMIMSLLGDSSKGGEGVEDGEGEGEGEEKEKRLFSALKPYHFSLSFISVGRESRFSCGTRIETL